METEIFNNINEVIQYLNSLTCQNIIFRGFTKKQELIPQLFRLNLASEEFDLLKEFEKYAKLFASPTSAQEFYFLCQHFGLPTRLLDFTTNPFVALFFSINQDPEPEDDIYKILYVNDNKYTPIQIDVGATDIRHAFLRKEIIEINQYDSYTEEIKGWLNRKRLPSQFPVIFPATITNQRIFAQQGLFYISLQKQESFDPEILISLGTIIRINKALREPLLEYLANISIDSIHLFPGLDTLAAKLKKKHMENTSGKNRAK